MQEDLTNVSNNSENIDKAIERGEQDVKQNRKLKRKVKRKNVIISILVVIIILLLLVCLRRGTNPIVNTVARLIPQIEDSDLEHNNSNITDDIKQSIDIPLITDFTVTKDAPYLNLSNPTSNADSFYLQYELVINGESQPLYTSDLVEPGKKFSADIYSLFDKPGTYNGNIVVHTYRFDTFEKCNGANMDITITVK